MARSKTHKRDDDLRGEVRKLRKRLKQARKLEHEYIDKVYDPEEEIEETEVKIKAICPQCQSGELRLVLNFNNKEYYDCDECSFRKVVKL